MKKLLITAALIVAASTAHAETGTEKAKAAANCLRNAGFTAGTPDQVKAGEAHFALVTGQTAVGIPFAVVQVHPAVTTTGWNFNNLTAAKAVKCLEGGKT